MKCVRYEHRLGVSVLEEGTVGFISHGENVRLSFTTSLSSVLSDHTRSVDRETDVRIESDQEETGVSLKSEG